MRHQCIILTLYLMLLLQPPGSPPFNKDTASFDATQEGVVKVSQLGTQGEALDLDPSQQSEKPAAVPPSETRTTQADETPAPSSTLPTQAPSGKPDEKQKQAVVLNPAVIKPQRSEKELSDASADKEVAKLHSASLQGQEAVRPPAVVLNDLRSSTPQPPAEDSGQPEESSVAMDKKLPEMKTALEEKIQKPEPFVLNDARPATPQPEMEEGSSTEASASATAEGNVSKEVGQSGNETKAKIEQTCEPPAKESNLSQTENPERTIDKSSGLDVRQSAVLDKRRFVVQKVEETSLPESSKEANVVVVKPDNTQEVRTDLNTGAEQQHLAPSQTCPNLPEKSTDLSSTSVSDQETSSAAEVIPPAKHTDSASHSNKSEPDSEVGTMQATGTLLRTLSEPQTRPQTVHLRKRVQRALTDPQLETVKVSGALTHVQRDSEGEGTLQTAENVPETFRDSQGGPQTGGTLQTAEKIPGTLTHLQWDPQGEGTLQTAEKVPGTFRESQRGPQTEGTMQLQRTLSEPGRGSRAEGTLQSVEKVPGTLTDRQIEGTLQSHKKELRALTESQAEGSLQSSPTCSSPQSETVCPLQIAKLKDGNVSDSKSSSSSRSASPVCEFQPINVLFHTSLSSQGQGATERQSVEVGNEILPVATSEFVKGRFTIRTTGGRPGTPSSDQSKPENEITLQDINSYRSALSTPSLTPSSSMESLNSVGSQQSSGQQSAPAWMSASCPQTAENAPANAAYLLLGPSKEGTRKQSWQSDSSCESLTSGKMAKQSNVENDTAIVQGKTVNEQVRSKFNSGMPKKRPSNRDGRSYVCVCVCVCA